MNRVSFQWLNQTHDHEEMRVHEWIQPYDEEVRGIWDAVLFGVPLSRSSISASGASEFPEAFRRSWKSFSTYNIDLDTDLSSLKICDLGDVAMSVTNIGQCHENIYLSMKGIQELYPKSLYIAIGGDHSITAMLVKGLNEKNPERKIGILQFDTHLDLRDLKTDGPTNGTPIRNLIEQGIIEGKHVYNIGPHGFFNTKSLVEYAKEKGVHVISLGKARKQGIPATVQDSLDKLAKEVDIIYLTCDMDVLDISHAPGVPASTPGGMYSFELFEALEVAGAHKKVKAMDIVCLDPLRDFSQQTTVKAGTHAFLSFLSGYAQRCKLVK